MSEPTDADRAKAAEVREALVDIARAMNPLLHDPLMTKVAEEWVDEHILPVIAAALAAERAAAAREAAAVKAAVLNLADEWEMAAELYDAAAMDGRIAGDLMAEGGHLIQATDARRAANRIRAAVAAAVTEANP